MAFNNYPNYYQQPVYPGPMPDHLAQLRAQPQQLPMQPIPGVQQMTMPQMQPPPNAQPFIWVQGIEAARAYMVAPGNTVELWDSEQQTIYLKSADGSGMPTLRILDWVERNPNAITQSPHNSSYPTRDEFERLAAKVEELSRGQSREAAKEVDNGESYIPSHAAWQ